MYKKIMTVLLLCASLAVPGWTAVQPGAYSLSIMYGGQMFDEQSLDHIDIWNFGLGYNIDENWGAELVYARSATGAEARDDSTSDTDIRQYRLDGIYHFMPSSQFVPYFAAGLGAQNYDLKGGGDESNLTANYGGGIKWFFLDDLIALRGDVRILIDLDEGANNLLYTAGLHFQLGKAAPAPQPIAEPTPVPVPPKPRDSDNDGVSDSMDRCPNTPSGIAVDANGCPFDSDNDGVYDYLDKCPDTPAEALVNANGCPLDSDNDGVYDYLDKCPGTPAGYSVDADGCPATMTLHINFAFDSSVITPTFIGEVEKAAECVLNFPGNYVVIEGHTDSTGSTEYNQKLSERRAQAVKQSLIEQFNLPVEKLSCIGYGEENPVADNATAEGRAQNRRVEVGCTP
jgi:OOP family OmpA-OmpF porin